MIYGKKYSSKKYDLMKKRCLSKRNLIFTFFIFVSFYSCDQEEFTKENTFWYKQPASKWMEALPVGNGRLGAMVFGDPHHERIQLNEDSMWSGGPDWGNSKGTPEDLEALRKLVEDGEVHKADKFIVEKFSYKSIKRSHQTMGDLFIDFEEKGIENYKRTLNLDQALASVNYLADGVNVSEKVFASNPDDVLMVIIESDSEKGLNFNLKLDRPLDNGHQTVQISTHSNNEIIMDGMVTQFNGVKDSKPFPIDYGVKFETRLKVKNIGGELLANNNQLELKGVQKAIIYIVCETSFYHENYKEVNENHLSDIFKLTDEQIFKKHVEDYSKLFKRTNLNLGGNELDSLATDIRLKRVKKGDEDPDLTSKLFQYGRYLLISSSRPETNPANLQGIWNSHIEAPWNADYHLNINLQMNYWPAEVTNLNDCHQPLFDYIDRLIERGRITAKEQYNCRGSVLHHASDLWATPWMRAEQPYWGSWVHGGGWIVQHYWEAYQFNSDKDFLQKRAYPAMKACAEFYLDWLVKDTEDNSLVSFPSASPENSYIASDGKPAAISKGDAMSHQIIAEVFDNVLASAKILKIENDFVNEVREKRKNLSSGFQIGEDGRLLEWDKPYEEAEKGHRHMSHLYGLHPGDDITSDNKELFEAAKKTIDYRLAHGGAGTGWSRAWMVNFNARLLQGEKAFENLKKFTQISLADNMFDMHPPFQIDGNFGITAGIAEMLLQSHEGFLRILPALPMAWEKGSVKGLKARGNITVDIKWELGKLIKLNLASEIDQTIKVIYEDNEIEIELKKGEGYVLNHKLLITN